MAQDNTGDLPEGWVTLPGGGIVPAKMNRATGWQGDRDSVNTAEIMAAHRAMSRAVATYREVSARAFVPGADLVAVVRDTIRAADVVAECWQQFTEVTGGEL